MIGIGIDYHKKYSVATMIDTATGEVRQKGPFPNTPEAFRELVGDGRDVRAVLEAGRGWGWLYDLLDGMCDEVKLAHPLKVKAIAAAKIKNDRIDSRVLAQLLCADLIPEAHARGRESRKRLAILRQRVFWVQQRTRIKNRIHDLVDGQGATLERPRCTDLFGKAGMAWLRAVPLGETERKLLDDMLEGLVFTNQRVGESDRWVERLFKEDPVAQRLATIPGIGKFFAVLIRNEMDDVKRFPSPERLHSYAGVIPSTRASGGVVRHGRLTKEGNHWLRWAAVEAAIPAAANNYQLRTLYEKHKKRKGAKQAKIVVARRLLSIVYQVWRQEREFIEYLRHHEIKRAAFIAS